MRKLSLHLYLDPYSEDNCLCHLLASFLPPKKCVAKSNLAVGMQVSPAATGVSSEQTTRLAALCMRNLVPRITAC